MDREIPFVYLSFIASACTLALLIALSPNACAYYEYDDTVSAFISVEEADFTIGSTVNVTLHVFKEGRYYDGDSPSMSVSYPYGSYFDLVPERVGVGLYQASFVIQNNEYWRGSVYNEQNSIVIRAGIANETHRLFEIFSKIYCVRDLVVQIFRTDIQHGHIRPGDKIEFEVRTTFKGELVDPDPDYPVVWWGEPDENPRFRQTVDNVSRTGTGRYQGVFDVPTEGDTSLRLCTQAYYTSKNKSYYALDRLKIEWWDFYNRPLDVWRRLTNVTSTSMDLEVGVLDTDGAAVQNANVSIQWAPYSYTDNYDQEDLTIFNTSTDAEGRVIAHLVYPETTTNLLAIMIYVSWEGILYGGSWIEDIVPYPDSGPPQDGFAVKSHSDALLMNGEEANLSFRAFNNGTPFGNSNITVFIASEHGLLYHGNVSTDSNGYLSVQFTTPIVPLADSFYYWSTCYFQGFVGTEWETTREYVKIVDADLPTFGSRLLSSVDTSMRMETEAHMPKREFSIGMASDLADGEDEVAFILWANHSIEELDDYTWRERWNLFNGAPAGVEDYLDFVRGYYHPPIPLITCEWRDGAYVADFNLPAFMDIDTNITFIGVLIRLDTAVPEIWTSTSLTRYVPTKLEILRPAPGERCNGTLEIAGTSDGVTDHVEIRLGGGEWLNAEGTSYWTYSMDTTKMTSTSHLLEVRIYDGEYHSRPIGIQFIVDQVPKVAIIEPTEGRYINGTFTILGTSTDDLGVVRVELRLDGGDWVLANGTTDWSYYLSVIDLPSGNHTLEARAWDGHEYGTTGPVMFLVDIPAEYEEPESFHDDPVVFVVFGGLLSILLLAIVATTEPGKYSLGLLVAPLFTRTVDFLDSKSRNTLIGAVVTNPGIHYSALRKEAGLSNGATAHHLHVLEREGFIKSVRDGKLKRFYSAHTKIPDDAGRSPEETREVIVDLVRGRPGISQLGVIEELGLDRDSASYYLRDLVKEGRLRSWKDGWYTVYKVSRRQ